MSLAEDDAQRKKGEDPGMIMFKTHHARPLSSQVFIRRWDLKSPIDYRNPVFDCINIESTHLIITDDHVSALFLDSVQTYLQSRKINAVPLSVRPGEASKSLKIFGELAARAIDSGIGRNSTVISLGGGVVKDLSGMLAATLYRGLNLVHIPTTLLAQVDGTIDFNQALNMAQGKNLIGTFYAASTIWINTYFLQTLDDLLIRDGLCECAKHAFCHDSDLLERLLKQEYRHAASLEQIVKDTINLKMSLSDDQSGLGEAIKQYGHCIGHAFEHLNFAKVGHGASVAYGMCVTAEIGCLMDLTTLDIVVQHYKIFESLGFQDVIESKIPSSAIWKQVHHDKHFQHGLPHISLLSASGTMVGDPHGGFLLPVKEHIVKQAVINTQGRARALYCRSPCASNR